MKITVTYMRDKDLDTNEYVSDQEDLSVDIDEYNQLLKIIKTEDKKLLAIIPIRLLINVEVEYNQK